MAGPSTMRRTNRTTGAPRHGSQASPAAIIHGGLGQTKMATPKQILTPEAAATTQLKSTLGVGAKAVQVTTTGSKLPTGTPALAMATGAGALTAGDDKPWLRALTSKAKSPRPCKREDDPKLTPLWLARQEVQARGGKNKRRRRRSNSGAKSPHGSPKSTPQGSSPKGSPAPSSKGPVTEANTPEPTPAKAPVAPGAPAPQPKKSEVVKAAAPSTNAKPQTPVDAPAPVAPVAPVVVEDKRVNSPKIISLAAVEAKLVSAAPAVEAGSSSNTKSDIPPTPDPVKASPAAPIQNQKDALLMDECRNSMIIDQLGKLMGKEKLPFCFAEPVRMLVLHKAGWDESKITPELITETWRSMMGGLAYEDACRELFLCICSSATAMVEANPWGVTRETLRLFKDGALPPLVIDAVIKTLERSPGEPLKWSSMLFIFMADSNVESLHGLHFKLSLLDQDNDEVLHKKDFERFYRAIQQHAGLGWGAKPFRIFWQEMAWALGVSVWKAEVEGIHLSAFLEQPAVAGPILHELFSVHGRAESCKDLNAWRDEMAIHVAAYKAQKQQGPNQTPKQVQQAAPKQAAPKQAAPKQMRKHAPKHNAAATNALRGLIGLGGERM